MDNKFTSFSFKNRLKSMFSVDFRRLFISPIYYILIGISFVIPILVLVMTTLMVGTTSTDPVTGEITVMEPIKKLNRIVPPATKQVIVLDIT